MPEGVVEHEGVQEGWRMMLAADPLPWLTESNEPAARWVTLVELLDGAADDAEVRAVHDGVLADSRTRELLARLPDWEMPQRIGGHDSPAFAPNLLHLLADLGVGVDDDPRIARLLDQMLAHTDEEGRFASFGAPRGRGEARWGVLLCDTHAIADVLLRYGRGADGRLRRALARMETDTRDTAQGRAWPCRPDDHTGFRGPGRKGDFCPLVTLWALRAFSRLPGAERPPGLLDAARAVLRAWRARGAEKPYMFGHGRQFKTVKWPPTWYGAFPVLDVLGRYPALWRTVDALPDDRAADAPPDDRAADAPPDDRAADAPPDDRAAASLGDRRALAELAACLIAYNVSSDGTVTPRSVRKGFEAFSFGQKKLPSAWATARLCVVLRRFDDLAEEIAAVDVITLSSSKGGAGTAVPPVPASTS